MSGSQQSDAAATSPVVRPTGIQVDPAFEDGQEIGRYVVLGEAGRGSMGVVVRAYDPKLRREVAVKVLRRGGDEQEETVARLMREAQALAQLSHPNVVSVYDVDEDRQLVAMEFVEGSTLRRWVKAAPRSPRTLVDVFIAAGRGLAAAHAVGLVHRDFKPDNVLMGDDGRVRVTDFGLARPHTATVAPESHSTPGGQEVSQELFERLEDASITDSGIAIGTPAYMAPEQYRGEASALSDQYAFAVALWEALVGKRPFRGTGEDLYHLKRRGPPAFPRLKVRVGRRAAHALIRALAPRPDDRWPSMDALLDRLAPRRRGAWLLGTSTVLAVGFGVTSLSMRDDRCTGAGLQLDAVWDETTRTQFRDAVSDDRLLVALDRWAEAWTDEYTEACTATEIRKELPPTVLRARMSCLFGLRAALGTTVELGTQWGRARADEIVVLIDELPPVTTCADVDALLVADGDPDAVTDPELQRLLREAWVLLEARELDRAGAILDRAASHLGEHASAAAAIRLDYAYGVLAASRGDHEAAVDHLGRAWTRGLTVGPSRTHAQVALALADELGLTLDRSREATWFSDAALAMTRVIVPGSELEASAWTVAAGLRAASGALDDARAAYASALEVLDRLPDSDKSARQIGGALNGLGTVEARLGHTGAAVTHLEASALIFAARYGDDHPSVARAWSNLANVHLEQGETALAIEALEKAEAIWLAREDDNQASLALVWAGLGGAHRVAGRRERATAFYERALEAIRAVRGDDAPIAASIMNNLGLMARDDERPTDALEYYRAALAIRQKRLPAEHPDIAKSHFLIASVLSDLGRHREARAALDRAEAIRGDAPFEDVAREADYHEVADKLRDAETRAPAQAPVPPLDAGPRPGP